MVKIHTKKAAAFLMSVTFGLILPHNVYAVNAADISAKAAILIEAESGRVIYSKNADKKLPMASTTKIMTVLLTLESGGLDEEFVVDSEAIKTEGSSMGLREGDIVSKRDLCTGMLLPSGNDAANAAAVRLAGDIPGFADMMNAKAGALGMNSTHFVTPSGLHDDEHFSTAHDMALLAAYAVKNADFRDICSQSSMKLSFGDPPYDRWLTNSNKLLKRYEGCFGVKTGFTDEAGRCLVSAAERNNVTLICVTLNAPDDWNDHAKLFDMGFSRCRRVSIDTGSDIAVPVVGGSSDKVVIKASEAPSLVTVSGQKSLITCRAAVPQFLYAPIKSGDEAGRLYIYESGRIIKDIPLIACEDIAYIHRDKQENTVFSKVKEFFSNITEKKDRLPYDRQPKGC